MVRQAVRARTAFAAEPPPPCVAVVVRQTAARPLSFVLRLAVLPLVAIGAAATGLVFVVLLPICGIASIAEAMSKTAVRFVRDAISGLVRGGAHTQ